MSMKLEGGRNGKGTNLRISEIKAKLLDTRFDGVPSGETVAEM